MLFFGILSILLAVASAQDCYQKMKIICDTSPKVSNLDDKCSAKHGQIVNLQSHLQGYANHNLLTSFQYLLMSSHFGNYDAQREGFKALYRKLSDQSWEDTISVLKYLGKRGGYADFNEPIHDTEAMEYKTLNLDEIISLSMALDMQKGLAKAATRIHSKALQQDSTKSKQDAGIIHYMQEQFVEPQTERIRDLAGYINDMHGILTSSDASIGVYLFDEYLKKIL